MSRKNKKEKEVAFEELLGEKWSRGYDVVEVSIGDRPLFFAGIFIFIVAAIFLGRILYLNVVKGDFYSARALANQVQLKRVAAARGLIYDRNGKPLVENEVVFNAILDVGEFLKEPNPENILGDIEKILGVSGWEVWQSVEESGKNDFISPIILKEGLSQAQLVQLESLGSRSILMERGFLRNYMGGGVFSSLVGYIGRIGTEDLEADPALSGEEFIGKSGVELFYDDALRGEPGVIERRRDAKGGVLSEEVKSEPKIGESLNLTIDKEFQEYFYGRLAGGLASLGRRVGVGIAIDPRNGEILALANLPGFDSNILSGSGRNDEKIGILTSPHKPLFNRAVSGIYTPGSTIKPLVAVAALKEGVVESTRKVFSPGYIDIPNPYNEDEPTRFKDWRYQGYVDLASAIAQSSNVYFYVVGGGAPQGVDQEILAGGGYISGLGINRLHSWWAKFLLGKKTGIDLPGEAEGILPSPEWKEERVHDIWRIGDTYNVSIGQGDLLVTPIQLLNYIAAIANGGKFYEPTVNISKSHPKLLADLSELLPEIKEVRKGMEKAVTSELGTAHLLSDLGFKIAAKTGTSEVRSKSGENAFFVGYLPAEAAVKAGGPPESPLAILILVENSLEGSLNTVPIAKDVLNWYYWNRVAKK